MKFMLIAGARPNFMKIASIVDAIEAHNLSIEDSRFKIEHCLVHTGQHYDSRMSDAFFSDLKLPRPQIYLGVGSGSHATQTAEIMKRFEPVLLEHQPDVVMVVGDVNSTLACALVAAKVVYSRCSGQREANHKDRPLIAHVEAGLRSFDRTMPEEINRILTDAISDLLFTTEESANGNLKKEGIPAEKIIFVGNTMIDTLLSHKEAAQRSDILNKLGLSTTDQQSLMNGPVVPYGVLTLHRPSNVDNKGAFENILEALKEISKYIPIIFPVHPRTHSRIKELHLVDYFEALPHEQPETNSRNQASIYEELGGGGNRISTSSFGIHGISPLGYLDFLCLMSNAEIVLTDSGGVQEETTVLGIPCITMRENTERPVTLTKGTNVIVGTDRDLIIQESLRRVSNDNLRRDHRTQPCQYVPLWDGKAGQRIIKCLVDYAESQTK